MKQLIRYLGLSRDYDYAPSSRWLSAAVFVIVMLLVLKFG